jgi:hypothetical protein
MQCLLHSPNSADDHGTDATSILQFSQYSSPHTKALPQATTQAVEAMVWLVPDNPHDTHTLRRCVHRHHCPVHTVPLYISSFTVYQKYDHIPLYILMYMCA